MAELIINLFQLITDLHRVASGTDSENGVIRCHTLSAANDLRSVVDAQLQVINWHRSSSNQFFYFSQRLNSSF
jgi:hypothetical protein